jgi:hypothetical protein
MQTHTHGECHKQMKMGELCACERGCVVVCGFG